MLISASANNESSIFCEITGSVLSFCSDVSVELFEEILSNKLNLLTEISLVSGSLLSSRGLALISSEFKWVSEIAFSWLSDEIISSVETSISSLSCSFWASDISILEWSEVISRLVLSRFSLKFSTWSFSLFISDKWVSWSFSCWSIFVSW